MPSRYRATALSGSGNHILLIIGVGFLVASLSAPYLDARLTTHVYFDHARTYLLGYYVVLLTPLFPFITYIALSQAADRKRKIRATWLPFLLATVAFLPYFLPEYPHVGFCLDIGAYTVLAGLTAVLEDASRPPDRTLQTAAHLQQLAESVKEWRSILFISTTSYLVLAVYLLQLLWTISAHAVKSPREVWILGTVMSGKVVIFSILVMLGPITTIFRGMRAHQQQFLTLSGTRLSPGKHNAER
jgi:hypothetical protein